MVTIAEIKPVRSMCCIMTDSGEQFWIRQKDLPSFFAEGLSYDPEFFMQNIRICQYPHALNHAVSLLSRRPHSKKEITSRLIRLRYTEEVADLVIYKLEKERMVDDEDFCQEWIRSRMERKISTARIRAELKSKGITDSLINACFERIDPDKEQDNAVNLAKKAWKRVKLTDDIRKNRQKVMLYLVRKGYDWDTSRTACKTAEAEMEK